MIHYKLTKCPLKTKVPQKQGHFIKENKKLVKTLEIKILGKINKNLFQKYH